MSYQKYAQSISEFIDFIKPRLEEEPHVCGRENKIVLLHEIFNYVCDNAHFVFENRKLAQEIENKLVQFWIEDKWLAARIYLQKLFPMSVTTSGKHITPKPL